MVRIFISNFIIFITCLAVPSSCRQKQKRTFSERIKNYESRAKTFQTLADLQSLSPPYPSHALLNGQRPHHQKLKSTYFQKAKKYRTLADNAKKKAGVDHSFIIEKTNK